MKKIPFEIFRIIRKDDVKTFISMIKQYNIDINVDLRKASFDYSNYNEDNHDIFLEDYPCYKEDSLILFIDYAITRKAYKICKYIAGIKDHELTSCAFGSLKYAIETNSIRIFNVIWKAYEGDWEVEGSAVYAGVACSNNLKIFRYLVEKKKLPFEDMMPCIYNNIIFNKSYKITKYLYEKFNIEPMMDEIWKDTDNGKYYKRYIYLMKKFNFM